MILKNLAFAFFISLGLWSCNGGLEEIPLTDDEILKSDLAVINAWLEEKGLADSVIITSSGLRYIPMVEGTGLKIDSGDIVKLNYTGRFFDNQIFGQNSASSPLAAAIGTGQLIPGFSEGVDSMRVGSKYKLLLISKLGYGRAGQGSIPPNTPIYFEIEVLSNPEEQSILDWIEDNNYADQITTLPNGLRYLIFHDEPGEKITAEDEITLNYEGRLVSNGTIFDTTFPANKGKDSLVFVPKDDNFLYGFEQGMNFLSKGDSALLVIPSKIGYGQSQAGSIPKNSALVFRVKIENVK